MDVSADYNGRVEFKEHGLSKNNRLKAKAETFNFLLFDWEGFV